MQTTSQHAFFGLLLTLGWGCGNAATPAQSATVVPPTAIGAAGVGATGATTPTSGSGGVGAGGTGTAPAGSGGSAAAGKAGSGTGTAGAVASTAGTGAGGGAGGGGGSMAGAGGAAGAVSTSPFPQLPRVTTTDGPGPFASVVKVMNTPPGGWLIYPTDIGKGGMKHPVFVFGPGAGTGPDTYDAEGHWDRYGSYGFVIYCVGSSTNDGSGTKAALDWVLMQNDDMSSPLYHNLDTSKVAVGGHSLGSIMTFAFLPDDRVTTSVHISGGSFDMMGSTHLKKETMFMCGPDGNADLAQPQCDTDYMVATVPIFYTKLQGATHITSARLGWAATIAWLLWHLADQGDQWKKEFLETTGQFQTGIYVSQTKNWP